MLQSRQKLKNALEKLKMDPFMLSLSPRNN
jgi:hypothetical protein